MFLMICVPNVDACSRDGWRRWLRGPGGPRPVFRRPLRQAYRPVRQQGTIARHTEMSAPRYARGHESEAVDSSQGDVAMRALGLMLVMWRCCSLVATRGKIAELEEGVATEADVRPFRHTGRDLRRGKRRPQLEYPRQPAGQTNY